MNGQHFKELVEIICYTTNCTKIQIANCLNITPVWLSSWQRRGLPRTKAPLVLARLREFLFENIGG